MDEVIFIARFPMQVLRVTETHEIAGTDGGAVTLDVLNVPIGSAVASGTSILASTFNLKSTANTPVVKEGTNLTAARVLTENQRIALKTSGTLTSLSGVQVTIYYKFANRGDYN